jgi:hypothetical protein
LNWRSSPRRSRRFRIINNPNFVVFVSKPNLYRSSRRWITAPSCSPAAACGASLARKRRRT